MKNCVKCLRNRQLMRSRRSASKRPFSGLVSIFPGNSRYNETQNPENWIFLDSRKSAQIKVKTLLKMAILSWKIHFLWSPLWGRFSAKNTDLRKIFRISFHPDFHFSSQIPSFFSKIRFSRKTSNFDFASRFSRFCMSRIFPRSGQGVTLGQRLFSKFEIVARQNDL